VKLFAEDMTKQDALMLILKDQHEHLGKSMRTEMATDKRATRKLSRKFR
jgi:hypothetical protein